MPTPYSWSSTSYVPFTWTNDIDSLIGGKKWTSSVITYSFPGYGSWWATDSAIGYGPSKGGLEPWAAEFMPLTATDQTNFRSALTAWSNVADVLFVPTLETSTNVGDIRVAYTYEAADADAFAWSYLPANTAYAGDIWFNVKSTASTEQWSPGTYSFVSAIHELGHALGLKHPFEGAFVLPTAQDTISQTVMSYSAIAGDDGSYYSFYPTTPMVLDIQAIQEIYGANTSYHSGADNYSFDDSQTYFQTIWDGGGNNAISYTGTRSATIDLREGHGSTIGLPVHAYSSTGSMQDVKNIWIAYGTHIQTALGGSAGDTLIANDAGCSLYGAAGNDTLKGAAGNDTLTGGAGNDTITGGGGHDAATYIGTLSHYAITKTTAGYQIKDNSGVEGTDTVSNVQEFDFADLKIDLDVIAAAAAVAPITVKSVVELYIAFFNRVPDSEGMTYWLQQAAQGVSITKIADSFYAAALQYPTLTGYSGTMSNADFVSMVYKNVLGRTTVDSGGMQYWTTALANGTETHGTLVESILTSAHTFKGDATYGWVANLLDNKYVVGHEFSVDLALSYETATASITKGMQIAAAVTPTDTSAAITLIGVDAASIHLV
jgi:serralysin